MVGMQLLAGGVKPPPQILGQRCGSLPDGTEAALLATAQGVDRRLVLKVESDRAVDQSQSEVSNSSRMLRAKVLR